MSTSKLAGNSVRAAYLDLPVHRKLKLKARVHFLDKWEGTGWGCITRC